jgi:hypothetical protein
MSKNDKINIPDYINNENLYNEKEEKTFEERAEVERKPEEYLIINFNNKLILYIKIFQYIILIFKKITDYI